MLPEEVLDEMVRGPAAHVVAFLLGTLLGSFANVCILRIPEGRSIVRPGSACGACGRPIRWYDNIPILSWLALRGRCRACGARFSPRYLLVEALLGLLALATWHHAILLLHPADPVPVRLARFSAYLLFELALVVLAFIDLDHKRIPDRITYPAIPFFLAVGLLLRDRPWWDVLAGAVAGYGIVRLIADGYWLLTRREGMGYGDGKLLAMVGGLLGLPAVLFSLFGGALLGSLIGISAIVARRRRTEPAADQPPLRHVELPFGPFLVAAAIAWLFVQESVALQILPFLADARGP